MGGGLEGGDARTTRDELRVPTRRLAQWNREDGLEAVNDVPPDQQRYSQTVFLDGDPLQFVYRIDIHFVQDGSDAPLDDGFSQWRWDVTAGTVDQTQLPDLFVQGHLRQQLVNPLVGGRRMICFERHRCIVKIWVSDDFKTLKRKLAPLSRCEPRRLPAGGVARGRSHIPMCR